TQGAVVSGGYGRDRGRCPGPRCRRQGTGVVLAGGTYLRGLAVSLRSVLGRALRHERVLLPDEGAVLERPSEVDVPLGREEVGDGARVDHADRLRPVEVLEREAQAPGVGIAGERALDDAGELHFLARVLAADELARPQRVRRSAGEARVEEKDRQRRRHRKRDDQPHRDATPGSHAGIVAPAPAQAARTVLPCANRGLTAALPSRLRPCRAALRDSVRWGGYVQ